MARIALLLFGDNIPVFFKGTVLLFSTKELGWLADDEHSGIYLDIGNYISKTRFFFPYFSL